MEREPASMWAVVRPWVDRTVEVVGSLVHDLFGDPGSRTWLGSLAVAALVALILLAWSARKEPRSVLGRAWTRTRAALTHRSTRLDVQLMLARPLLRALGVLPGLAASLWIATWSVRHLDAALGTPASLGLPVDAAPSWAIGLGYTVVLFVVWDASRFALHWAMHRVPALWALHQVHHSAGVLTPLTFHRLHPLESVLYTARSLLVTTAVLVPAFWLFRDATSMWSVLGVHVIGFSFNLLFGNLRHSHVWLRFGALERWLVSPAQHQIHHSRDPALQGMNLGTWLSVWDRLAGTWVPAGDAPPKAFGLADEDRNHGDDLVSALIGPIRAWGGRRWTGAAAGVLAVLLLPAEARGEPETTTAPQTDPEAEPEDGSEEDPAPSDDDDMVVVVETEGGMPRVAGSAQRLSEEDLERFEHDDVGRVLVEVPGVYVRGEDGLGLRPNIGVRAASSQRSSKITLLEDGIPFAPAPYAAPAAYYFPLTTRMVGIEVLKGPAAIQNGPNTVGGAVNLQTRKVPIDGLRAGADLAAGSYRSGKAHLWAGGGDRRGGWLIEGAHLGTAGFWNPDYDGPVGSQRTELMAKGRVNLVDTDTRTDAVEIKLGYSREDSRSTYLGIHPDDYALDPYTRYPVTSEARMQWGRSQAVASYVHRVRGKVQIRVTAYRHQLRRSWRKFNDFAEGPDAYDVLTSPDSGANASWLALLRGEVDTLTPAEELLIGVNDRRFIATGVAGLARFVARDDPDDVVGLRGEVGLRVHHDDVIRQHTEDRYGVQDGALVQSDAPTLTTRDDTSRALGIAAHTAWDLRLGAVHVEPGLRTEVIRTRRIEADKQAEEPQWRVHPLPGLGLRWQPRDSVAVYAGGYRGFSPVAPGQSPDAEPEQTWNGELGLRVRDGTSQAEATLFISDYTNLTGQCTFASGCRDDQVGDQFNAGRVRAGGLELAGQHRFELGRGWGIPVGGSYTWTRAAFLTSFQSGFPQYGSVQAGDALPYLPEHQGSVRAGLSHPAFSVNGTVEATSGQLDIAGDRTQPDIPARALVHASTSLRVYEPIRVYATLRNALGSEAIASLRPLGARPVGARTLMIGVKAER